MSKKGAYPQQQSYPVQQPAMALPNYMPTAQVPPPYTEAPPSYAEPSQLHQQPRYVQAPPNMGAGYPGAFYVPVTAQMQVGPNAAAMPMGYYAMPHTFGPSSTVIVNGGYDAGARFGAGATPNLPPPPPGCPPNAAQIAAMQGSNVVVTQRKSDWLSGGSDGGFTIW
ncbi:DAZ-associated protein 2 [Mustelus asterias]